MAEKQIRGDKFWRGIALIVLCGLVYYFSYDHGRQSLLPQLKNLKEDSSRELDNQRREILRLQSALTECTGGESPASTPTEQPPSIDRFPLKVNQSKILFSGRLVVTLLKIEHEESKSKIQLNFIEDERLVSEDLPAGGSIRFTLDGHNWAVVLSAMSLSTVNLNLVELKNK